MEDLFLYLNSPDHAAAWIRGGSIPLAPASTYRSEERRATLTPDENIIRDNGNLPRQLFEPDVDGRTMFRISGKSTVTLSGYRILTGGRSVSVPDGVARFDHEDGLILCFSRGSVDRWFSESPAKQARVRIVKLDELIASIDSQLSLKARQGAVRYTSEYPRDVFLKSNEDAWQNEYRSYWNTEKPAETWVNIPAGTAEQA